VRRHVAAILTRPLRGAAVSILACTIRRLGNKARTLSRLSPFPRLAVLGKQNFLMLLNVLPTTREQVLKTVHDRSADH
jgi:hypothetical protein